MIRKSFSILFLWLCAMGLMAQQDGYDPVNPPNPDVPQVTYVLATSVQPTKAGSTNVSNSRYAAGSSVYVYTNRNNGYVFKYWTDGTDTISTSSSFYYTMPASDKRLIAVYEYDPTSPDNPSGDYTKPHTLTLKASPSQGGYFNYGNSQQFKQGQQLSLYAYSNSNYQFKHWEYRGVVVGTNYHYNFTMPDVDTEVVAVFEYNPASPKNPGSNSWNKETGELIMDDFTMGYLSSAIYDVTNGNTGGVQSLIVNGQVSDYDIGNMEGYPFSVIDFSRCSGTSYVPAWSFDGNTTLTSISLPSCITRIGYYSFYNCECLTSIACYATVPPVLEDYVFEGIKDQLVAFVPTASIDLYQEADGWKELTILPLQSQVNALEVNLPDGSEDGRFKNMFLELVNINSGQRMRYVISDRTAYTFQNLMHNTTWNIYVKNGTGQLLGKMENVEIKNSDRSVKFASLVEPQVLKAVVLSPDGNDITDQLSFTWMNADGSYLGQGTSVAGVLPIDSTAVILRVTLPQTLAMQYRLLSDTTYVVKTSDNTIRQTLSILPKARLTGVVRDVTTGAPLKGATVTISQTLNGRYSKSFMAIANGQGEFSINAFDAPTSVTAAVIDYISKTVAYGSLDVVDGVATLEDISLKSIKGAIITVDFTYMFSAVAGTQGEVLAHYDNYRNIVFDIRDITTGKDINDFNVQYPQLKQENMENPQIVLLEDVALGDSLQITATSKTDAFTPVVAKGRIDEMNRMDITFNIKQLGQISASFISTENPSVNGILYDEKGRFLKSADYTNATLNFTDLPDGNYTLVTMGSSNFFNTIFNLSKFAQTGLVEGTDYVSTEVGVKSGIVAVVKTPYVPFFDESKFYYTGENTSFSVNKTQVMAGNYLTLNSRIDFKQAFADGVTDVKLIVDMPETCSLVNNSVMVGSAISSYLSVPGRVTIPVTTIGDRIRFCVIPTASGNFTPSAYAQFTYNGQEITQPIGQANFAVKDLSITVPKLVARATVPVSGTAIGKSTVQIYDGDILIGQTNSLANGKWATTCELYEPENLSTHNIFAKVTTGQGLELQSETMACLYNIDAVTVNTVTMLNHAGSDYVTVFDFQNPQTSVPSYTYAPSNPEFTFLIDLFYRDVKLIPFVWLHVYTSNGKVRSLRANYNESKDRWIAVDKFNSDAVPIQVSVSIENMVYDPSDEATYNILLDKYVGDITLKDVTEGEDGSTTLNYTDGNGDDAASITIFESDQTVDELAEQFKENGFEEDELLNDDSDYVPENEEDSISDGYKDYKVLWPKPAVPGDQKQKTDSLVIIIPGKPGPSTGPSSGATVVIIRLIEEEDWQSSTSLVSSTITNEWQSYFHSYFDEKTCSQITEYIKYTEHLDRYVTVITSTLVSKLIFVDYTKLPEGVVIPRKLILSILKRIRYSAKRYTTWTIEYSVVPKDCTTFPPPPPPPDDDIAESIIDPSGYVYEGVPSNRLEGVTATAYYKETGEDMYGDPYEREVLWDAAEYAQENPLFTDENGFYRWDVPQGLWRVKFEKEGYQTTYSEWLPVPPPQLEVNIAMTQARQPEVKSAKAYEDGVEVEFDKYMQPESLTTDNIIVKKNDERIDGTIELLNSESIDENNLDGSQLASRVKFAVLEGVQLLSTDEITVVVTTGVKSYAGLPLQDTYTQTFDVEKAVRKIVADSLLTVLYEGTRELQVSGLPADAAVGKTLRIRTLSTLITNVSAEGLVQQEDGTATIQLDENGQATLTVSGDLPGSTALQFSIDGTSIEGQTLVKVQQAASLISANPRASRASGSAVYRGTLISLSSDDENARIWYTLDGTCPCDPATALVYTKPIPINDDYVVIKAIAQVEGFEESEVVTFEYIAKQNSQELALREGWTWISHNQANNLSVSEFPENTLEVKSQTKGIIRDEVLGLFGNLQELSPIESYKVKSSESVTMPISGDAFNASKGIIKLHQGWNWLGYPIDQVMTPNEALENLSASEGDILVGLSGSAEYIDGNWIGDLDVMTPGQGYMMKAFSANDLLYNTSIVSRAAMLARGHLNISLSPWSVDENRYADVMPLRAQLYLNDELTSDDAYTVAAFHGTECRGIGKNVQGVIFMNVHGEGQENITFLAANNETEEIDEVVETLPFKADVVGSYKAPYILHLGSEATGIKNHYNQLDVWPAIATTEINVSLNGKPIDLLTLTGMDGKTMLAATPGASQKSINVSHLPTGIYIVAAKCGSDYFYKKIVKSNK